MEKYLSNRIKSLSESQTLAMAAKSRELKAQGIDVISLSLGEPDFNTPDFIISSKDLACALNVSDKKIRIVNNDLIILLNIFFPLFYLFIISNVNQK